MIDVAVIGGGVSGLSCGYFLARRGFDVAVLERQVTAGGNAVSERIGRFLMEHGPSSVSPLHAEVSDLSRDLGLDAQRLGVGGNVRYRYLTKGGTLARISAGPAGFLTAPYLSLRGRGRLLAEIAVPRRSTETDESVAEFFVRRFGHEFTEKVIDPVVGGLYAARAEDLDMALVFPKLVEMECRLGSVTLGIVARMIAGNRMPGRRLFSWRDGIGALPRALARRLGRRLATGVAVRRIAKEGPSFRIEAGQAGTFRARSVVLATQPHVAAGLIEPLDEAAAEALSQIPSPPISVVFLGYSRDQVAHPLDGIGYLTPSEKPRQVGGALFCSTMFADRAPEGHVAVSAYIGGSRAQDAARLSADDLVALARADVEDLLGVHGDPVLARVRHWPRGLPQMTLGHGSRLAAIAQAQQQLSGLFLTGNYVDGIGIGACVTRASRTSDQVTGFLGHERGFRISPEQAVAVAAAMP